MSAVQSEVIIAMVSKIFLKHMSICDSNMVIIIVGVTRSFWTE
jgi:hypothetical protein